MSKFIGYFSFENRQVGEAVSFEFGVEAESIGEVRDMLRDGLMTMAEDEDFLIPGAEIYLEGIVKLVDFDAKGQLLCRTFTKRGGNRPVYEFGSWPHGSGVQVFTRDDSAFEEPFIVVPLAPVESGS